MTAYKGRQMLLLNDNYVLKRNFYLAFTTTLIFCLSVHASKKKMDLATWNRFKRSGTYKREVQRRYEEAASSSRSIKTSNNNQRQVEDTITENGSVQNKLCVHEELASNDHVPLYADQDFSDYCDNISESLSSDSTDKNQQFHDGVKNWAISYNISHAATKSLIEVINKRLPNTLPKDPRTLLETEKTVTTYPVGTGQYWHNGLTKTLKRYLQMIDCNLPVISLNINIDGLPAFKSSKLQLWPILCNVYEIPKLRPIVIGIYSGYDKPLDLDGYLRMFVDEMKKLLEDGLSITVNGNEKKVGVKIRAFICDSPARAMIKGVCNYNGKNWCLKCTVQGEYSYVSNTVVFPRVGCPKRNNEDFRAKKYGQHHKADSPLLELPIDMIEDFVVGDALHLLDLGIMKRFLTGWKDGKFKKCTKWSSQDIAIVTNFLVNCKMPREIHRSVRGLDHLSFWKGSEYRSFLYYLGFIILKYTLSSDAYQHFLCFYCAITISSNEKYFHFLDLADSLLNCFLEHFRDIYGESYITSNVHNLSHIIDEVKKFGKLQDFSAYPFENQLFSLKRMIRHGNKPLEQVAKRINEKIETELQSFKTDNFKGPFITYNRNVRLSVLHLQNFIVCPRKEDKWFLDIENNVVETYAVINGDNGIIIYGNRIEPIGDVFKTPIKSSYLNIYKCKIKKMNKTRGLYKVDAIKCKLISISYRSTTYFVPLLHTL